MTDGPNGRTRQDGGDESAEPLGTEVPPDLLGEIPQPPYLDTPGQSADASQEQEHAEEQEEDADASQTVNWWTTNPQPIPFAPAATASVTHDDDPDDPNATNSWWRSGPPDSAQLPAPPYMGTPAPPAPPASFSSAPPAEEIEGPEAAEEPAASVESAEPKDASESRPGDQQGEPGAAESGPDVAGPQAIPPMPGTTAPDGEQQLPPMPDGGFQLPPMPDGGPRLPPMPGSDEPEEEPPFPPLPGGEAPSSGTQPPPYGPGGHYPPPPMPGGHLPGGQLPGGQPPGPPPAAPGYHHPPMPGHQYPPPPMPDHRMPDPRMHDPRMQGAQPYATSESLRHENLLRNRKRPPVGGWRKALYSMTGGAFNPGDSKAERHRQRLVELARRSVPAGHYRVAVMSLKGGVGKTTTTIGLGSTLAHHRGDRVIAVDANPDRGTLSEKVRLETRMTVRDLLNDRANIRRYADVRSFTSQSSSRLEVLASDRDPAISEAFNDIDYAAVAEILEHHYSICLTDCGTGMLHAAMSAILNLAHQIVLVSPVSVDGARSASATLDWLEAHGHGGLARHAVVVLSAVRSGKSAVDIGQLQHHFANRCRAVVSVPFDPHLDQGSLVDLELLRPATRDAYLTLAATVADGFDVTRPPGGPPSGWEPAPGMPGHGG